MATKTADRASGLFDQAVSTFGDAMKAGVKIQEDIGKWWSDALDQSGPAMEWQKRSRAIVQEADLQFTPGQRVRLLSSGGVTRVTP